jgi:hypothetical protein
VAMTVAGRILQPARRAAADQVAHDEPEIEAARMNQQALEDIRVAAQMRAPHPTRVVEMREGAGDSDDSVYHRPVFLRAAISAEPDQTSAAPRANIRMIFISRAFVDLQYYRNQLSHCAGPWPPAR